MSRIRSIKPDFWSSEQVMSLSRDERLLFIGLWNFADDAGRIKLNPTSVKAQVLPGDDDATKSAVVSWISSIIRRALVECYENDGTVYGQITGWSHQKIDRPQPPKYPGLQDDGSIRRTVDEYAAIVLRTFATDPIGSEGKGSEGKENAKPSAPPSGGEPVAKAGSVAKPGKARPANPAFDRAVEVIAEEYRRAFPNVEPRAPTGSIVGKLLKESGGDPEKIRAPLRAFLSKDFWHAQGGPLETFAAKYASWERAASGGGQPPANGSSSRPPRARATTGVDFENEPDLEEQMKGWTQ